MPHYATWERAPYHPYECVVCTHEATATNVLVDTGRVIEDYGDVYLCASCISSLAEYLGIVKAVKAEAEAKLEELNQELDKVPALIERLVNGIRDLSISTSADLLAISAPVVLVDDKDAKQSNIKLDENEHGDDSVAESVSEPVVDKGSDSVPAGAGSKRTSSSGTRTSTTSNR